MTPGPFKVDLIREPQGGGMSVNIPSEHVNQFAREKSWRLYVLAPRMPEPSITNSRFLAKVGLEALALRIENNDERLHEVAFKAELDLIRDHARRGHTPVWPISIRKIYDQNARWESDDCADYQIVHEFDFLVTKEGEYYFVLAIFGIEMVINMGGPELDGWEAWLSQNGGASPLRIGKNLEIDRPVKD